LARFEEIGVRATAEGVDQLIFKLGAMNKAISASGAAGVASAGGIGIMSAALGVVVAGAVAAVAAVGAVTVGLFQLGKAGVETAASVESAFAGVLKTTQGLGTNLFDLTDAGEEVFQRFRDMAKEIPLTFEQLAEIGQFVGQLGFAEDQLVDITRIVAAVGDSTDLSMKQAALVLSRFATVMSDTGDVTVEEFERMASSLVFLGNTYEALESEIILTARNIAATGGLLGATEGDILGISTAVIKAGVTAEAGGSAIQNAWAEITKVVFEGGERLEIFAETAGKTTEEFAALWKVDATQAFSLFIEGLTEQGLKGVLTLDDLGLASRRSFRTLSGISRAGVDMAGIIEDGNMAYEKNISLMREAEIRWTTFDSKVQILKNRFRDMGITVGLELLPRLAEIVEKVSPIVDALGENLQPIIEQVSDTIFEKLMPALGNLLDAFGIDLSEEGLVTGIETLGDTISTHIENFSIFVDKVATLVELSREKGLAGFFEGLGFTEEQAQNMERASVAVGTFVLALKGLGAVAGVVATLATVGPILAEIGAFFSLIFLALSGGAGTGVLAGLAGALTVALGPLGAFLALLATLAALLVTFGPSTLEIIKGLSDQIGTIFDLLLAKVREKGPEWATAIRQFFIDNVKTPLENFFTVDIPAAVENISAGIRAFVEGVGEKIRIFFQETLPQVFEDLKATISDWAKSVVEEIKTKIITFWEQTWPEIKSAFREAGKSIIGGFIAGIKSKVQKAIETIRQAAGALIDAASDAFGISSPSSFAIDIAENFMGTLADSFKNMTIVPQMAMASAMERTVSAGMRTIPSISNTISHINRGMSFGDINVTQRPESPASMALTLQQLALVQQGAS
jgi:TP901 family phage tail tape measure protein